MHVPMMHTSCTIISFSKASYPTSSSEDPRLCTVMWVQSQYITLGFIKFLNMPLSQLPKSFGLVEMKKGYFPHLYNTEDNNRLECMKRLMHMPDPSYYDTDNMYNEARDKFFKWYKIHGEEPFDMDRELLEYYHSHVDILLNM